MTNSEKGYKDAANGNQPDSNYTGNFEYMNAYHSAKVGIDVNSFVGAQIMGGVASTIAIAGAEYWKHFVMRLPFIFPSVLILFFLATKGVFGLTFSDFMEDLSTHFYTFLKILILLLLPINIIFYYFYFYLRGIEFANYILKKNYKPLYFVLGLYTLIICSIGFLIVCEFFGILFVKSKFFWFKFFFYVIATLILMHHFYKYHWSTDTTAAYLKKSKFFRKGMLKSINSSDNPLSLEDLKNYDIASLDHKKRKKSAFLLKVIVFIIVIGFIILSDKQSATNALTRLWIFI